MATNDERRLGAQLQAVLSRAHGQYIAVAELRDRSGRELGLVFHYGGDRSWVFVTLDRPLPPGRYVATLVARAGAPSELGTFDLGEDDLSLGATTRIDLLHVTGLRLRALRGGQTLHGALRVTGPAARAGAPGTPEPPNAYL